MSLPNNEFNQDDVEYDPYPMTSPEARALASSVRRNRHSRQHHPSSSSSRSHSSSSVTDISSSSGSYDNDSYDDDNHSGGYESDEEMEVVWTSMEYRAGGNGPSAAAVARIRGGGTNNSGEAGLSLVGSMRGSGSSKKKSKKQTQTTNNEDTTTTPAAVMEEGEDDDDDDDDIINQEDEFLDRPVYESRARGIPKLLISSRRLLERIVYKLYGDTLPIDEFLRILTLASTLFFMIGGYWLLRSLKDPVITALCGVSAIPKAKMLSVFIVLGIVSIYNYLLDTDIPKHKLFYLFGTFYFCLFTFISIMLLHPTYGLANEQPSLYRILGWVSYCSIESFGSVMVTLFWSFANSNISLETAKSSYGLMVATAQVGSILGPTFVQAAAPRVGVAACYMMGAITMLLLQASMYTYVSMYGTAVPVSSTTSTTANASTASVVRPAAIPKAKTKTKEKAGILEGLKLLWVHDYVKGIFAISCFFMIEVTILDYTMKVLARDFFAQEYPCDSTMSCYNHDTGIHGMSQLATTSFSSFMGTFGQATNFLSFSLSLFGTSAVIHYLGLRLTLLLFPSLCLAVIIFVRLYPSLYVVFGAMMILKANSYALNNPTKEILYQPTNPAIKYKAKSWIDIFGDRLAKATGSLITNAFADNTASLISNGSFVGMIISTFLIWNANRMGHKFDEYTETGYIVGGDKSELEAANIHMAIQQNNNTDTSCAIFVDDHDNDDDDNNLGLEREPSEFDDTEDRDDDTNNNKKPQVVMV